MFLKLKGIIVSTDCKALRLWKFALKNVGRKLGRKLGV